MNSFKFEPLKQVKRGVLVDTDIGPDCDDVGALVVLYALAKRYSIPVLGVVNCTSNPYGCGAIDVVSKYCGQYDIPVGMYSEPDFLCGDNSLSYNKFLSQQFATEYAPVGEKKPEEAVALYRRVLAAAEDKSIMLVTVGPLNTVAALLRSQADSISPKDGRTLIQEKVYAVVSMAGRTEEKNREFNIICDGDASEIFLNEIPVPVIFSGFEVGVKVASGFADEVPENAEENPVYQAYKKYTTYGNFKSCMNQSYDLTAVQFAFEGEGEFYSMSGPGRMVLDRAEDDATEFVLDENGNSYFMELNCSPEVLSEELSNFLKNAGKD